MLLQSIVTKLKNTQNTPVPALESVIAGPAAHSPTPPCPPELPVGIRVCAVQRGSRERESRIAGERKRHAGDTTAFICMNRNVNSHLRLVDTVLDAKPQRDSWVPAGLEHCLLVTGSRRGRWFLISDLSVGTLSP